MLLFSNYLTWKMLFSTVAVIMLVFKMFPSFHLQVCQWITSSHLISNILIYSNIYSNSSANVSHLPS